MANFPNSVTSFSNRSNGQTIDASHVNDLQNEVNAIEDGYLNGSARLNSSNSTIANLSVQGNSTLGSTIAISTQTYIFPSSRASVGDVLAVASTSGSTATLQWQVPSQFSTGATVSTGIIRQNSLPAWDLFLGSTTPVAANSSDAFGFDTQNFVRGDVAHSTSVNSSRVTLTSTGLYMVNVKTMVNAATANAAPRLNLRFNDQSTNVLSVSFVSVSGQSLANPIQLAFSGPVLVSSAGYFTVTPQSTANSTWGSTDQGLAFRFSGYFLG